MPYRSIRLAMISMVLILASSGAADAKNDKPKIAVAPDGFPTGLDTPEGAASDLERAYINHDSNLFANVCIGLYVNHTGPALYDKFMRETIARLDRESSSKTNRPKDAKAIAKVFAARHFSRNGPASYGYAGFDFRDVQFVDVQVTLHNGEQSTLRVLVIKTPDDKWHAHPAPKISPLLCAGLDEEAPSTTNFSSVYEVSK